MSSSLPSISDLGFQDAARAAGVDPSDLESLCDRYAHGDCYALALAVAEATGWPLRALVDGEHWAHVVAVSPSGHYVDAYGAFPDGESIALRYGVASSRHGGEARWLDVEPEDVECAGWMSEDALEDDLHDARVALDSPWMRLVLRAAGHGPPPIAAP